MIQILIYRRNKEEVNTMCTWFYAEKSVLSPIITKAQQLPLTDTIMNTMARSAAMSGNIRPTDMAAESSPQTAHGQELHLLGACVHGRCADSGGRYGKIGFYGEITEVSL